MPQRYVSGVICFVGPNPVSWSIKRKGSIETSSYYAYLCAVWVSTEEAISLSYSFWYLGAPVKGLKALCGYNQRMIIYSTNPDFKLKKHYVAISYHTIREYNAAGIVNPIKFCTMVN